MRPSLKINGSEVHILKPTLNLNSRLAHRISTAGFDILGEERWVTPGFSVAIVPAMRGYTHPYGKDEVVIDRAPTPMQNCAISIKPALGGESTYLDHFFGGYLATKEIRLVGRGRFYRCTAQDYNILTTQQLVTESYVGKTEQEIIDDLFSTYLPEINTTTYVTSSETLTIDWTRVFLDKVMEELATINDRKWYIDHEKKLHYFTPSAVDAPFGLSSSPSFTTQKMYNEFQHVEDDSKIVNKVTVIGDTAGPVVVTRTDAASYAKYGRYFEGKIVDRNIDTDAWANLVGDAELARSAFAKIYGKLSCYQEGLVIGQVVSIYNFLRDVDDDYLIQSINLSMLSNFTEKVVIEYGDYNLLLTDLLLKIKALEETE